MHTVTAERHVDAAPTAVRSAFADTAAFMRAGGYDEVEVDGESVRIRNHVGLLTIELDLHVVDDPDAVFAYEQVDGIFESMTTAFRCEPADGGTLVTGQTTYALDTAVVGPLLDATVIARQRRKELAGHFDYLEAQA